MTCFVFANLACASDQLIADEYQIKAAFLYKFTDYVEWPPEAFQTSDAALVIGVFDADPIADFLASVIAAKKNGARPVTIRRLGKGDTVDGLHVLFVGKPGDNHLDELLTQAATKPILVVTETGGALARGSTINFVVVDDKVRFDVAPPPAGTHNIKVSARLLGVARKVVPRPS